MSKLNTEQYLAYAAAGSPVVRDLEETNQTMTYKAFGQVISLIKDEWKPWHRQQIAAILDIIAAVNDRAGDKPVEFWRVVNAETGVAGSGAAKKIRIETT